MKIFNFTVICIYAIVTQNFACAYEINNHADMSQEATNKSALARDGNSKLSRLGLRQLLLTSEAQTFPLAPGSGAIPYCYGSARPDPFDVVTDQRPPQQDNTVVQPNWNTSGDTPLTIAQMFRYGACFEDSESPTKRPLSHFYNVQDNGSPISVLGPNSLEWNLKPGVSGLQTGQNHYGWKDARDSFYLAITSTGSSGSSLEQRATLRKQYWGQTFQALGHVMHHLQDMGSPQHVRGDAHCNLVICKLLLTYRPSGYETYFEQQYRVIKSLAASASAPILFGLPREFWNANTTDNLTTSNPTRVMNANEGIAAYASTNFVTAGTDFDIRIGSLIDAVPEYAPAINVPFPKPAGYFNDTPITNLFPADTNLDRVQTMLCGSALVNCKIRFMGTEQDPNARASSVSVFSQTLLRPRTPFVAYAGSGAFQQNFFTYTDAAIKLVPKAVEYSAGLIDYFFRGEMAVRLPAEGVYGLIDGGDPASNCKDACGFKKLKVRLKNVTAPINGVAQDFANGTLTAVVKFSRNSCFQSDFSADPGPLYPALQTCFVPNGIEPVEEQVIADPLPSPFALASGAETALTLNFAVPIPVNAWNIKLQFVFRGQLGQEQDAVAAHTHRLSSPTPFRYMNEYDYLLINQKHYTRAEVNASQTLLNQVVPSSCVTGAAGSKQLAATCFNPQTIATSWTGSNGAVLASLNALPTNAHAMWVYLIDFFGQTSASFPGPLGTNAQMAFYARDLISPDDDSSALAGDRLLQWRNLQSYMSLGRYHLASTDQTSPSLTVMNQRAAFPTTTPVKMTTVNF